MTKEMTEDRTSLMGSEAKTLEEAKNASKRNKKIILIRDNGEGKPSALNLAFKKAKGDILIFTDGDVFVDKDAIPLLLKKFKNPLPRVCQSRDDIQKLYNHLFGIFSIHHAETHSIFYVNLPSVVSRMCN